MGSELVWVKERSRDTKVVGGAIVKHVSRREAQDGHGTFEPGGERQISKDPKMITIFVFG